jgi:3-dehydroquinate synthase
MRRDKKARGALLRFVVLEGIGRPVRLEGPDEAWLRDAFDAISH